METSVLRYNHCVSLHLSPRLETRFEVWNKDLINAVISNSGQATCYEKVFNIKLKKKKCKQNELLENSELDVL